MPTCPDIEEDALDTDVAMENSKTQVRHVGCAAAAEMAAAQKQHTFNIVDLVYDIAVEAAASGEAISHWRHW